MNMVIEWVSPGELIPYEGNAKQHPPEQVKRIANSIKAFGWQQPIVVDRENVVVIGHGRLFAAKDLMLDTVPIVRADNLTEEQINALRLADNKTNESEWDFGKLEEELAALSIAGMDMAQFGFAELADDLPPENLDNPETYGATVACKLTFDNFIDYNAHEEEIKAFANEIGAVFSVVKP